MLILILMFLSFDFRYLEPTLSCWVRALPCPTLPPSCRLWRGTFHSAGSPMKGPSWRTLWPVTQEPVEVAWPGKVRWHVPDMKILSHTLYYHYTFTAFLHQFIFLYVKCVDVTIFQTVCFVGGYSQIRTWTPVSVSWCTVRKTCAVAGPHSSQCWPRTSMGSWSTSPISRYIIACSCCNRHRKLVTELEPLTWSKDTCL